MNWEMLINSGILLSVISFWVSYVVEKRKERKNRLWDNNVNLLGNIASPAPSLVEIAIEIRLAYFLAQKGLVGTVLERIADWITGTTEKFIPTLQQVEKNILETGELSVDDFNRLMDVLLADFASRFEMNLEKLKTLLGKNEEFRPKTEAEYLAYIFINDDTETIKKIQTILHLCYDRLGNKVSRTEISQNWAQLKYGPGWAQVTRYLNQLDGRNLCDRQLKRVLQRPDNENFLIEVKDKELVEKTFAEIEKR